MTHEKDKNRPTHIDTTDRLDNRLSDYANPTLVDTIAGVNQGGANTGGVGIHTAEYRRDNLPDNNWDRPAGPLLSGHVGISTDAQYDNILIGNQNAVYRQASQDLSPGQQDIDGTYNLSDQVIPAGVWYWGTNPELPQAVRITHDARPRVTGNGIYRVVAL